MGCGGAVAPTDVQIAGTCASRLHGLAYSVSIYLADSDDLLPLKANWVDALEPYHGYNQFMSPDDVRCPLIEAAKPTDYGISFNESGSAFPPNAIADISSFAVFFDSPITTRNASSAPTLLPTPARHDGENFQITLDHRLIRRR
jgi:hypothetical protein